MILAYEKYNMVPGGKHEVFMMAYPTIVTMLAHAGMGFADSIMVGALGTTELGAVGFTNILYFTLVSLFMGTIQIVNTFVSQDYGRGNLKETSKWAWQAIYLAILAWPILLTLSLFCGDLFKLFGPSQEVQYFGCIYGKTRLYGSGMFLTLVALTYYFRGIGMVKTPMYAIVSMSFLNVGLDYLFIYGKFGFPQMGVAGAAWASVASVTFATICLFIVFLSPTINKIFSTRSTYRFDIKKMLRLLKVGIPSGVQIFMDIASFTVFIAFIGRMGDVALAANQVALQIEFLGFNVCHAFSVATTTLVGQYIGAGKSDIAMKSTKSAFKLLTYYLLVLMIVVAIFPDNLIRLFAEDEMVINKGVMILYLAMVFMIFDGMGVVAVGALRGAGDTRWPMVVAITAGWFFFLPLAYTFGEVLEGGVFGAWLGATIYIITISIIYVSRFTSGNWKQIKI
jgi:MATE family, multidrug efflux pump